MKRRRGFAMLTVLWVLVVAGAIAAAGAVAGNDAAAAIKNRLNGTRAYWGANACAERAQFVVDRLLLEAPIDQRDSLWRSLSSFVLADPLIRSSGCAIDLVAAGSRLNVNAASEDEMLRLFEAMSLEAPQALAASLSDWIDPDDDARQQGAESAAYVAIGRRVPRNAPLGDAAELRYVRGFETIVLDSVLGVDSARISVATAPLPVLAALPGFTPEAIAKVAEWRSMGRQVSSLLELAGAVSSSASSAMVASFPEISRRATVDPEAWLVTAQGHAGLPAIAATVEIRLVRAQSRAAVVRTRVW
jgi:type II secretory pathway component PulK